MQMENAMRSVELKSSSEKGSEVESWESWSVLESNWERPCSNADVPASHRCYYTLHANPAARSSSFWSSNPSRTFP